MPEELVIRHCSPTLAGLKTANMFTCRFSSAQEMNREIRLLNKRLVGKGLRVLPLRYHEGVGLIYIYRPSRLERDLRDDGAEALLAHFGYRGASPIQCVAELIRRLQQSGEFPHEIGLFLGYPPEDVRGFIENRAGGSKCVGSWKVYGDVEKARKTFEKYEKCSRVYYDLWSQGRSIERLTVAV